MKAAGHPHSNMTLAPPLWLPLGSFWQAVASCKGILQGAQAPTQRILQQGKCSAASHCCRLAQQHHSQANAASNQALCGGVQTQAASTWTVTCTSGDGGCAGDRASASGVALRAASGGRSTLPRLPVRALRVAAGMGVSSAHQQHVMHTCRQPHLRQYTTRTWLCASSCSSTLSIVPDRCTGIGEPAVIPGR